MSQYQRLIVFLVDTDSTMPRGIPPSPMGPPPSNEAIRSDWGVLTGPCLPSHIPFQIIVQVFGRDVPQTLIDEGVSIIILSSFAWQALGFPQLVLVMKNMLAFNRRTSQPLGTLPQFPVTLGGKLSLLTSRQSKTPCIFLYSLGKIMSMP